MAYKTKVFSWNVLPSSLNKSTPATPKIFTWRNLKHGRGKMGRGGIFLQMATAGGAAPGKRTNISGINLSSKTSGSAGHQNEFDLSHCNFSSDPSARR